MSYVLWNAERNPAKALIPLTAGMEWNGPLLLPKGLGMVWIGEKS